MKRYIDIILKFSIVLSILLASASCDSLDKVQKKWSDGPEQIYVGKFSSLKVHSGINRVEIVGGTEYARTAKTCVVTYGEQSVSFDMKDIVKPDGTVSMEIDNLEPGSYYFYVTNYDEDGNRSVKSEVYGNVYDEKELDTVTPYTVSEIMPRTEGGSAIIYWNTMGMTYFYKSWLEFSYTDADGKKRTESVEPDENGVFPAATAIESWTPGGEILVQSYVRKEEDDLDIFRLPAISGSFPKDIEWAIPRFAEGSNVNLGSAREFNLSDGYTIELKMRLSEIQAKDGCIIGSTGGGDVMLLRTSHNRIDHYICSNWDWRCVSYTGIDPDRWYHIAVTYEPGERYTIYLDGVLVADGTDCGVMNPSDNAVVIGERTDYPVDFMKGDVQHVSIWENARTAEQIRSDMNLDFDMDSEGLLAYWPMTIKGNSLKDLTGNYTAACKGVNWLPAE